MVPWSWSMTIDVMDVPINYGDLWSLLAGKSPTTVCSSDPKKSVKDWTVWILLLHEIFWDVLLQFVGPIGSTVWCITFFILVLCKTMLFVTFPLFSMSIANVISWIGYYYLLIYTWMSYGRGLNYGLECISWLLHLEDLLIIYSREIPLSQGSRLLFWTRLTECLTWVLNHK